MECPIAGDWQLPFHQSYLRATADSSHFFLSLFLESWLLTTAWSCKPSFIRFSLFFLYFELNSWSVMSLRSILGEFTGAFFLDCAQVWTYLQWKIVLLWFYTHQTVHGAMQSLMIHLQWCVFDARHAAWSAQHICSRTQEVHIMRLQCREQRPHCSFVV